MTTATPLTRAVGQVSFSGHETFVSRYGWLKKGVDAVSADPHVFTTDEAMVTLGVGKNMVRSIRHWGLAMNILEEVPQSRGAAIQASRLGLFLLGEGGKDPYLEDPNSLWLLHWELATNERRATTWAWAFSLLRTYEFTREALFGLVQSELRRRGFDVPSEHSLRRDIDCFVRTYTPSKKMLLLEDSLECPLTELGLLEEDEVSGMLQFRAGYHQSMSMVVFAYALLEFWERTPHDRETLPFSDLAFGYGSPGLVLKLDENSLTERLERLEHLTAGRLAYTDTAGIRQVYRRGGTMDCLEFLGEYYDSTDPRSQVEI